MKIDIERLLCSLIECNTKPNHKYNWLADDIITSLRDQGLIYKDGQIIPELKESEDERIRKATLSGIKHLEIELGWDAIGDVDILDVEEWLEKQGTPAKLSEEEQNRFAKGVLTSCASSFIDYLDAHKYEGKMCVSNGECEDIENAFHNAMWDKLHRYYDKYIEKQDEQIPAWGEEEKKKLDRIYYILGIAADEHAYSNTCRLIGDKEAVELQDFLRSIAKPEQKSDWSEEDEKILSDIIKDLVHPWNEYIPDRIEEEIKWLKNKLKSLSPQTTWKPSERQLQSLEMATKYYMSGKISKDYAGKDLSEILNELKKLKG